MYEMYSIKSDIKNSKNWLWLMHHSPPLEKSHSRQLVALGANFQPFKRVSQLHTNPHGARKMPWASLRKKRNFDQGIIVYSYTNPKGLKRFIKIPWSFKAIIFFTESSAFQTKISHIALFTPLRESLGKRTLHHGEPNRWSARREYRKCSFC